MKAWFGLETETPGRLQTGRILPGRDFLTHHHAYSRPPSLFRRIDTRLT